MYVINKKKLNRLIAERFLTYRDLNKITGLSLTSLYNIRTGLTERVHPKTMKKLCIGLDCKIDDIATIKLKNE